MLGFYTMGILKNLAAVRERIEAAAVKAGRDPRGIKLVAVTKTVALPEIIDAVKAGVHILGENRVQEAQKKITNFELRFTNLKIEWHLIGHLQKNKAKQAVRLFDLIHTIDSVELAEEVNNQAEKAGKVQKVLAQVKLSEETAKHGVPEKGLAELLDRISNMNNLHLDGLMTMPPYFEDPEKARPYFIKLRELKNAAVKAGLGLNELSMGMSHDFEVAIGEGATIVRIGTAIFGERTQK
jgi:pyridoxal phosphate enzyme (YggS family)